ncbi:MAG: multifunctional oxoglutarate decarboxylase/oxoglutarate dehydrogenase thiamine pyrophosphate-binding subunit/dihydrolipoyllysine-residue succinyltransferase subunit [Gemmatimonadales bacterium]
MNDPVGADVYRTMNAGFVQEMYEQYLRDPASVDPEWRALFENGGRGLEPVAGAAPQAVERSKSKVEEPAAPAPAVAGTAQPMKGAAARLVVNMEQSLGVPTATSFRDIPVAVLDERRKKLNAALAPKKVSYTHLIAYALVQAAKQFPVMTHAFASIEGAPHRVVPDGIALGLAVDVEKKDGSRALVVPVIKRADAMNFAAFHAAYESLVALARAGQLLPDDYKGATMTLTNPGTIGTVASVPRLMSGQGSIIATGAIRDGGGSRVMTITSTYDHRVIQGAESGMFLRLVDQLLQGEAGFYEGVFESVGGRDPGASAIEGRLTTEAAARTHAEASGLRPPTLSTAEVAGSVDLKSVAASMALVRAHRLHGHALAHLDPLGGAPPGDPACEPDHLGLTPEIMAGIPTDILRVYVPGATMAEAFPALRAVYCGTIAYEFEHIASHDERVWLRQQVETGANRRPLPAAEKQKLLGRLTVVDALERFLHKTYLGQKRFSIEGLDVAVPMLDLIVEIAGEKGAHDVVIGMAHRGRLNVLAHVVNLPYETILGEFEGHGAGGEMKPEGGTGDVKYHHGAEGSFETPSGRRVTVTLAPNPSHLEAVNPVVEGRTRAEQTQRGGREAGHDVALAVPVLLHGDAAFTGQGIVAETFNLARLSGYATGGTVHIITNNQIGFTTNPKDSRSTDYASDLAKGFDTPIVHVNADDPEACLAAVRLAMLYRERYHNDVVIDVVGYRRWGHNEGDEPSYTQPLMYEKIRQHPTARQVYAQQLAGEGITTAAEADKLADAAYQRLADAQAVVKRRLASQAEHQEPRHTGAFASVVEPVTAVAAETLNTLNEQLLAVPDGFTVNPKLKKQLERRRETIGPAGGLEWAHAEALAYASLLAEGVPVRLSGQDTERGTFSQRHLALHDANDGRRWAPIQNLAAAAASMELINSPLSEYACVGFEYGYAVAAPEALVLWEAQFGDFANGAEIIVDQFIFAGLSKWGQTSRLTLLLPHGYEGQGPEHSSARIERFAALGAEGNIRVANCSTPAQYFHLLRRQALHEELRPLVVFTPKSLLRLPAATSHLDELTGGAFHPVLDDPAAASRRAQVTRLLLCSGKVYYDLLASPAREKAAHVAIGRVELLYPHPKDELAELLARYPRLKEIVWVQEEPSNMGARKFITPELRRLAPAGVEILEVSRPERASPAEGYPAAHAAEQARIVREALGV